MSLMGWECRRKVLPVLFLVRLSRGVVRALHALLCSL